MFLYTEVCFIKETVGGDIIFVNKLVKFGGNIKSMT
jgi:hypothetical protein